MNHYAYRRFVQQVADALHNIRMAGHYGTVTLHVHEQGLYRVLFPADGTRLGKEMDNEVLATDRGGVKVEIDNTLGTGGWEMRFDPSHVPVERVRKPLTGAQDYINATPEYHINGIRPRVQCADGFEVSIQASIWHCCQPRVSGFYDYDRIEVGYPSQPVPQWAQWKTRTFGGVLPDEQSIFTWVPVSEVDKVIAAHGGITDTIGKGLRNYDGEDESPDITHDWGAGFPDNFGEFRKSLAAQRDTYAEGEGTGSEEPQATQGD